VSPDYAPLLGRAPVWFGPYLKVDERRSTFHILADAPRTDHGWRVKFLWVIDPGQEAPVTIRGGDLSGDRGLSLEPEGTKVSASATLDPGRPGVPPDPSSGFKEFPSYVYFPAAGCYFLEATWPGGSWRIVFAAGR
jgi:hypothetical protein